MVSLCRRISLSLGYVFMYANRKNYNNGIERINKLIGVKSSQISGIITRKVFTNFLLTLIENAGIPQLLKSRPVTNIEFKNLQYLEKLYKENKGVVIATVHTGNWEYSGAALAGRGYKVNAVAWSANNSFIENEYQKMRELSGVKIIRPDENAPIKILRCLRKGECVVFVIDIGEWGPDLEGEIAGNSFYFPQGPFRIAKQLGLPILPVVNYRKKLDELCIEFMEPVSAEDMNISVKDFCSRVEPIVYRYPDQWIISLS